MLVVVEGEHLLAKKDGLGGGPLDLELRPQPPALLHHAGGLRLENEAGPCVPPLLVPVVEEVGALLLRRDGHVRVLDY